MTALETLYGGEIVLSTHLIKPNYPVILSHQRSATVSLETYPSSLLSWFRVETVVWYGGLMLWQLSFQ